MNGIKFRVDEKRKKTTVAIELKKHAILWEDYYDNLVATSRAREPRTEWPTVKSKLRRADEVRG